MTALRAAPRPPAPRAPDAPSRRPALRRLPGPVWVLLLLALLLAQGLGQWHRVQHLPHLPHLHAQPAVAPASDHAFDHAKAHPSAQAHAWGHGDNDSPQCRLFDQLGCADATWPAWSGPGLLAAVAQVGTPPAVRLAPGRPARPWQARAPPRA